MTEEEKRKKHIERSKQYRLNHPEKYRDTIKKQHEKQKTRYKTDEAYRLKIRKACDKYSALHREEIREKSKLWRINNPEKYAQQKIIQLNRLKDPSFRERRKEYRAKYRKYNRDKIRALAIKRKELPHVKVYVRVSNRIRKALKSVAKIKTHKTIDLLGCSVLQLKNHLERQFKKGMSWENMGKWHIDHIIPVSYFDLSIHSEELKCWYYLNLRPMWAVDNMKRGNRAGHVQEYFRF